MTKALLLLTMLAGVLCLENISDSTDPVQTIKATVVAYDLGVEQVDGSCKQTAIARSEKSAKRNESDRYFIIRHQSSCLKLIPEASLNVDRKRSFKLKRDTKCDQTLEDLKDFITLSPTGMRTEKSPAEDRTRLGRNPGVSSKETTLLHPDVVRTIRKMIRHIFGHLNFSCVLPATARTT